MIAYLASLIHWGRGCVKVNDISPDVYLHNAVKSKNFVPLALLLHFFVLPVQKELHKGYRYNNSKQICPQSKENVIDIICCSFGEISPRGTAQS